MRLGKDFGLDAWATLSAAAVIMVFLTLVGGIAIAGLPRLSWEFLTSAPQNAGRAGGIAPILVSTLLILAVCMATVIPLGLATAALLAEFRQSPITRALRLILEVLAGIPSIVFGLFGNAFFSNTLGLGFSILSGGLTLACMALPVVIRTAEESLRALPPELRTGATALGMSRATTLLCVLLPAAAPGVAAGVLLGLGRALSETAALVFTSGYVDRLPESLLDSGRALSVHIYDLAMNVSGGDANASASALVLMLAILGMTSLVAWLVSRRKGVAEW